MLKFNLPKRHLVTLFLTGLIVLFSACGFFIPNNLDNNNDDDDEEDYYTLSYLDILNGKILNVLPGMEYSLNDKSTWDACLSSYVSVVLAVGNRVFVRQISDHSKEYFLGEVKALSGRADLVAGNSLFVGEGDWEDVPSAYAGQTKNIMCEFYNIGTTTAYSANHKIRVYLSNDREITVEDTLLLEYSYPYNCAVGLNWIGNFEVTIPADTLPGTYYVGIIVDATGVISELNDDNNFTRPEHVAEVLIASNPGVLPDGAFKFVNSWGVGGWENKADGHYWVTYRTMKKQEMVVGYYYNNFDAVYKPTVVAVFEINHSRRDEAKVIVGLGDPSEPYMQKELQRRWDSTFKSGPYPFGNNKIVLDISEFAHAINTYDLFLSIENDGTTAGSVVSFAVEYYSDYNQAPFKTITGTNGTISTSATTNFTATTKDALTNLELQEIQPPARSDRFGVKFYEEKPSQEELREAINNLGVYEPGKNYNKIIDGKYGTGLQPPSMDEWNRMVKLTGVSNGNTRGFLPNSVDHSKTKFFPPVGSQGQKGSCTAFAFAYYIQTYTEARERDWDLTGTKWLTTDPEGLSDGGAPDSNLDKIFSPDFLYHMINSGVDEGSSNSMAATNIIVVGGATWSKMPYDTSAINTWPSEAAWREAANYRGRAVSNAYWEYVQSGYIIIKSDTDIQLLKTLIAAGYCVYAGVQADNTDGAGIYNLFDNNDVADNDTVAKMPVDHAQTVVGYKEGSSWSISNPDN